jgi:hypothetical protein
MLGVGLAILETSPECTKTRKTRSEKKNGAGTCGSDPSGPDCQRSSRGPYRSGTGRHRKSISTTRGKDSKDTLDYCSQSIIVRITGHLAYPHSYYGEHQIVSIHAAA